MDAKLFEVVSNTPGVPGREEPIQKVVADFMRPICDDVRGDAMGNVIAMKKATNPPADGSQPLRVMLAAHSDEIGMMVRHIDGDGNIRFSRVGGLSAQVLPSQRVIIHGREQVNGVIAPDNRRGHGDKLPSIDDMLIDVAMPREQVCELVEPGDIITFDVSFGYLNDKVLIGRNFDDRLGTYCMLEAMRQVGETAVDVYAVSTVQEEVGVRGARTASYQVDPDLGLAIDGSVTWGGHIKKGDNITTLGEGAGIYIMDGLTIADRGFLDFLYAMCEKRAITYQKNIGGGTDASAMQKARSGARCTTVGAPTRYMHSTVQLCHIDDVDAMVALLVAFLETAHELPPREL